MEYYIVNSFSNNKFHGNPAAVIVLDEFTDVQLMQNISKQMNLVETVFVTPCKSKNEFDMRYFTPEEELVIAGHPTIAALSVLFKLSHIDPSFDITINTKKQKISARVKQDKENSLNNIYYINVDKITHDPQTCKIDLVADALGLLQEDISSDLPIKVIDSGLGHIIVPVNSIDSLFKAKRKIKELKSICELYGAREVQLFALETIENDNDIHTRNICPRMGMEDPACGIGNSALLAYLSKYHHGKKVYNIEQGYINNFKSIIKGEIINDNFVRIGGNAVLMAKGTIYV
ncbi:MAG: PhzF family phenazine biosynthesis protein [Clostridiales bacterium]|nr:PhzF family phenazine biosynthesis protein [Clostridiales bacterium]